MGYYTPSDPGTAPKAQYQHFTLESIGYLFMKLIGHLKYNIITLNRHSRYQSTNQNLPHDKNRSVPRYGQGTQSTIIGEHLLDCRSGGIGSL
jgi:hypothetical protein